MLSTLRVIETMEGTYLLTVKLKFKNSFLLDMKADMVTLTFNLFRLNIVLNKWILSVDSLK